MPAKETPEAMREVLFKKVERKRGCWTWLGHITVYGYGSISYKGKVYKAHRAVYELTVGKVPAKLVLDHKCRNRACVNPKHLQIITSRENVLFGEGATAQNSRKTHCRNGHEFTPENTFDYRGVPGKVHWGRHCRACTLNRTKRFRLSARTIKP